jgi:energy-coupling factor transporter ATP-binding protein EcfA2
MKDWIDILKQFGFQVAPWMIAAVLILYILRERLSKGLDALLDWLGTIFRGEWSYRRFESVFRPSIRAMHLYMRVVGIRSEKGREPTIPEAYVPLRLAPYSVEDSESTNRVNGNDTTARIPVDQSLKSEAQRQSELWSIDDLIQRHSTLVVLGDPGAGKSTLLKYLITRFTQPRPQKRISSGPSQSLLAIRRLQGSKQIVPCPIYVSLRSCQKKNDTLLEDILDPETKILASMLPSDLRKKMPPTFIERCVRKGRAILLLDGLDEVTDEEMYADVVRKINYIQLSYPENSVVVTSRIARWRSALRSRKDKHRQGKESSSLTISPGSPYK